MTPPPPPPPHAETEHEVADAESRGACADEDEKAPAVADKPAQDAAGIPLERRVWVGTRCVGGWKAEDRRGGWLRRRKRGRRGEEEQGHDGFLGVV